MIIAIVLLVIGITIMTFILHLGIFESDGGKQIPSTQYPLSFSPPDTPVVLVSAKDSAPDIQSQAAFHCTGRGDQQQIESAIKSLPKAGGTVMLAAGTYQCQADLSLNPRVRLMGMGEDRTHLSFSKPSDLVVKELDEVRDLSITGSASLFILESHVKVQNVTMTVDQSKAAAFYIYANRRSLEDFSFQNCSALNCGTHGFMINGEGNLKRVSFVTYLNCRSLNAGLTARHDPWVTGFDLTESVDLVHCRVQDCTAEGSWESGFHIEESPRKTDVVLENCTSLRNGQKGAVARASYGAGFLLSGDTTAIDCVSDGNENGYLCYSGVRLVRCSDRGSGTAYSIIDAQKDVNLQDCMSVLAERSALTVINGSDIRVAGFSVTEPYGNTDPIIELGSASTGVKNLSLACSVDCSKASRQIRILNGVEIVLSGDLTTGAEQGVSIEGGVTDGVHLRDLLITSSSLSSDSAGVRISPNVTDADTIWIERSVITAASPFQGLVYGVMNEANKQVKVEQGLTAGVTVPYYNCDLLGDQSPTPWFFW